MLLRVETNALTHPCWFGALKPTLSNSVETNALTHQFLFQKLVISVKEYTKMKNLDHFGLKTIPQKYPTNDLQAESRPCRTHLPQGCQGT